MNAEPRSTWRSPWRIGCALALVVGLALVAWNWRAIGGFAGRTASTMSALFTLQAELREHYRAPELTVENKRESGVEGSILSVEVLNAPLLEGLEFGTPASLDAAFGVAIHTRHSLPATELYDHYEVVLKRRGSGIVAPIQWHVYRFKAADLPPR